MIVTTKELFQHAYGKYAIGAYNINNLEQTMGLFQGNVDSKAPFIVQLSKGARGYTKLMLEALIPRRQDLPDAVFAVHLTTATRRLHVDRIARLKVMIDASYHPSRRISRSQARRGRRPRQGHCNEAELGQLHGVEVMSRPLSTSTRSPKRPSISSSRPAATRWPLRSVPRTALSSSRAIRSCALTFWRRFRSVCPASRWCCTAPPRCRRTRSPASMPPAARSRARAAWTPRSSSARPSSA